jgi:hypothetical protein
MPKHDLHSLARLGASARIQELRAEIAALHKAFPQSSPRILIHQPSLKRRKRRKMSAAARARISAAQKARWARQKAKK